jgi:hypothetical protein
MCTYKTLLTKDKFIYLCEKNIFGASKIHFLGHRVLFLCPGHHWRSLVESNPGHGPPSPGEKKSCIPPPLCEKPTKALIWPSEKGRGSSVSNPVDVVDYFPARSSRC